MSPLAAVPADDLPLTFPTRPDPRANHPVQRVPLRHRLHDNLQPSARPRGKVALQNQPDSSYATIKARPVAALSRPSNLPSAPSQRPNDRVRI